jgi:hypothetical protein
VTHTSVEGLLFNCATEELVKEEDQLWFLLMRELDILHCYQQPTVTDTTTGLPTMSITYLWHHK